MSEMLWPEKYKDFMIIENPQYAVNISWEKKPFEDYKKMAFNYYKVAICVMEHIIDSGDDNIKCDAWFMPGVFMLRQSIELGLKTLVCRIYDKKKDIQVIFEECGHNLSMLFDEYLKRNEGYLGNEEKLWLINYLVSIESVDEKSDLFRFPFEDEFLSENKNKCLEIVDVTNNLIQAFSLIKKCINCGIVDFEEAFDDTLEPKFLILAPNAIGNCYLWQPLSDSGFHVKVMGYVAVSEYVYSTEELQLEEKLYPMMFLLRNGLELCLKRLFYSRVSHGVPKHTFFSKRKSHLIKKDLWKNVKPIIEYYSNDINNDKQQIDIVEKALYQIDDVDKKGDVFRYPATYSFEYKLNKINVDLKYAYEYIRAIINFLEGCDSMLDAMADYEAEMYSYYESEWGIE